MKTAQHLIGLVAAVTFLTWGIQGNAADWFDDFSVGNADLWQTGPGNFSVVDSNYVLSGIKAIGR
jgi:hypothetical protein